MKPITLVPIVCMLMLGCSKPAGNTYAIKDFSETLQPYLITIVSNGLVGYDTATRYIKAHATDNELQQLSLAEHPILRAVALRSMLERKTFDHYKLVMEHLNDTAIVPVDYGEWGIRYFKVADDMPIHSWWKDSIIKKIVEEEIVLKHNNLMQAYFKASELPVDEKYYASIKQMALRKEYDVLMDDINFRVIEEALYALARYRKVQDISLIKSALESNTYQLGDASFGLMLQYPDTSYLSVYEKYYRHYFYSNICDNWGHSVDRVASFISSVATYKNGRSARILEAILKRTPFTPCRCDSITLESSLAHAVNGNMCEAYKGMKEKVNKILEEERKNTVSISYDQNIDTLKYPKSEEPISW